MTAPISAPAGPPGHRGVTGPGGCRRGSSGRDKQCGLCSMRAEAARLRYFTLDGTAHATHKEQGSMIRRYIIWRNRHADDRPLRAVVDRANVA